MRANKVIMILFFVLSFGGMTILSGQGILFEVLAPDELPVENASVQIFSSEGKTEFIEGGFSDSLGRYKTVNPLSGGIRVVVNYLGMSAIDTLLNGEQISTVILQFPMGGIWIDAVSVKANRSYIQRQGDRVVLKIDGSDLFGENAMKILENAPGVQVVNEDVTLLGQRTVIFLDGKPSKYLPNQLANILRNKRALNIDRIELIANPGTEFSADLQGRVINIVTKRKQGNGYDVSISARATQRSRYTSISGGVDIYGRYNNFGLYLSLGNYLDQKIERTTIRRVFDSNTTDVVINERARNANKDWGPDYSFGLDYDISNSITTGFKYVGYSTRKRSNINSSSFINEALGSDSTVVFTTAPESSTFVNTINYNISATIDTFRSSINLDIDFDEINSTIDELQKLIYNSVTGELSNVLDRAQEVDTKESLFGIKLDLIKRFKSSIVLKAGVKYSNSDVTQKIFQRFSETGIPDVDNFDNLIYRENIISGYFNVENRIGKYNTVFGLRGESTDYSGSSRSSSEEIGLTYFNVFPSLSISRTIENHYISFSAARKVSRPSFNQLIPFKRYISAFQYYTGNPNLIAYFPYSADAYYSFKNNYFLNIYYSIAKNRILEYDRIDDTDENITVGVKENNGLSKATGVGLGYNGKVNSWISLNSNVYFKLGQQTIELPNLNESFDYSAYSIYLSPSFTLGKLTRGNLNFYYSSDTYSSVSQNLDYWYFGVYVSRKVFKSNGTLSFTIRDLFLTGITRRISDYGNINSQLRNNWDSRQFQLSFSYSFGKENVSGRRNRRQTANSDVRRRANQ